MGLDRDNGQEHGNYYYIGVILYGYNIGVHDVYKTITLYYVV